MAAMVVADCRQAPDVGTQPVVTLVAWGIFEMPGGSRHFCGVHAGGPSGKGRVSSEVVGFDPGTMTGMTGSGRLYRLEGPPCQGGDAGLIRDAWLAAHGIDPDLAVPVEVDAVARRVN